MVGSENCFHHSGFGGAVGSILAFEDVIVGLILAEVDSVLGAKEGGDTPRYVRRGANDVFWTSNPFSGVGPNSSHQHL